MKALYTLMSLLVLQVPGATTVSSPVQAVFVKGGQLFVSQGDSTARQITYGEGAKRLPVWSPDGSKIAYLQDTNFKVALDDLIVIDRDGEIRSNILVRPAGKTHTAGMQFVEGVQWITESRIALSGSINPSTVETIIMDLARGTEVDYIYDDLGGATFSPDGLHVAFVTGSPHFTPESFRRPALHIDENLIYPPQGKHIIFLTKPEWSENSSELAIVTKDYIGENSSVVIWKTTGRTLTVPVALDFRSHVTISWMAGTLFLKSNDSTAELRPEKEMFQETAPTEFPSNRRAGRTLFQTWKLKIEQSGGHAPDFWCASCPLQSLPRGRGLGVHPSE